MLNISQNFVAFSDYMNFTIPGIVLCKTVLSGEPLYSNFFNTISNAVAMTEGSFGRKEIIGCL
jgi:hypothetical protein